mgnify:CR=1 FL=1
MSINFQKKLLDTLTIFRNDIRAFLNTNLLIRTIIITIGKAFSIVVIFPKSIFIPKNDEIIVGIDNTIVAAAKNFIAIFKLFDTINV